MFLCRNYVPGDRIFAFGFSRGAFTIRVLMKFVLSKGLVTDFGSSDELKRKSKKLYRDFRKEEGSGLRVSEWIRSFIYLVMWPFQPRDISVQRVARIAFLGLWDTVDAYGMPIRCGGMLPSITKAAHPIAAAVTVIVIAGQWCRRKARIGMQTYGFQIELPNRLRYVPQPVP